MLLGSLLSSGGSARQQLRRLLLDGNTVAQYRADVGVTGSLAVSSWANQLGSAPALAQGTGANQPIYLPYAGSKYGYLPGVSGNYFSTPDSVASSITGDIDIRVKVALDDWTPAAENTLVAKYSADPNRSYQFRVNIGGALSFLWSSDGSVGTVVSATSTVIAGVTDGATKWARVTMAASNRVVTFYLSDDGVTWTQLGNASAPGAATSIADKAAPVEIGSIFGGTLQQLAGKVYRAQIYNGIDGTLAVDFNPESASETTTNGATWTSATGETWTLNCTGAKPAQIVGSSQFLFDGAAHFLKTSTFTLAQPATWYLVAKPLSWTLNDGIFDGYDISNRNYLFQSATTPKVRQFAGNSGAENADWTVGTKAIVTAVYNGASSRLQIGANTAVATTPGSPGANGITLGSQYDGLSGFSNIQTWELIVRNVADSTATSALIQQYLKAIHGTP